MLRKCLHNEHETVCQFGTTFIMGSSNTCSWRYECVCVCVLINVSVFLLRHDVVQVKDFKGVLMIIHFELCSISLKWVYGL